MKLSKFAGIFILLILAFPLFSKSSINIVRDFYNVLYLVFFPFKESRTICSTLQDSIKGEVINNINHWSITVLDENGTIISDINGNVPRIPASNQKLITTAFALDRLGPSFKLTTSLLADNKGNYVILGQGDPDLDLTSLLKFGKIIVSNSQEIKTNKLYISLPETPRSYWWPSTWTSADRLNAYGAPITKLALSSNSSIYSIKSPLENFIYSLRSQINSISDSLVLEISSNLSPRSINSYKLLSKSTSAPLYALIGLANSESHNFTSEVLLRTAARNWSPQVASYRIKGWLNTLPLPSPGFLVADGSGLSRSNYVTTNGISHLLYNMSNHIYKEHYISSLSIIGLRGTLKDFPASNQLTGRFYGKTGTLTGVRSISGYLKTEYGYKYISVISNGLSSVEYTLANILNSINNNHYCSDG
ncbi:D-alanyl-D-alanine carboxypeptidase [Prochlorococcus marinus]|uniref:Serine-type D-Ala-D-Ala carboxypeptidase n=1 Tax=Prochlorococcus marinus (strain MIT 9211) TaxID=93059 RepID=A9BAE8_PROM4|nr:D-alanyl-D-alanine carboxypeptidase [Prochlorococcus marinus]ABX08810.1 Serine-type D-Ala-D-Ala carboxypeptidase [Prochlorococcus marinus str. MIT 9211]